jgi:transcriptional regulator with GAF, ATPase, and Fis domain
MPEEGYQYFLAGHMQLLASIAGLTAVALEHARYVEWLERENQQLKEIINTEHGMVGRSQKQQDIDAFVNRAGPSDRSVLISGETGAGKELVARAIHRNSLRASKEFVAVNCGAFPESLLESELFGHERGAFTGAIAQRRGLFELADGGTVFLDEIGEMPMAMQPALLRVLQEGEFKRLGGNSLVKVDVRVIAATNRNLENAVKEGRFRADLFFRLNVLPIEMPRLSERREDIPLLAAYFIKKHRDARSRPYPIVLGITPEAYQLLITYNWPGNIRELENVIERAIALGASSYIVPDDLPKELRLETSGMAGSDLYEKELATFRKALFERVLAETHGNRQEAARRLGFHATHFARLCHDLNVKTSASSKVRGVPD